MKFLLWAFLITAIFSDLLASTPVLQQPAASVQVSVDANNLKSWHFQSGPLSLTLVQRLPDQTRAFYLARGFSQHDANAIATQCVMQTIVKNLANSPTDAEVLVKLADWRVRLEQAEKPIKLKEEWLQSWRLRNRQDKNQLDKVKKSAMVAFKWSTFPTRQIFQPEGDYAWGMITIGLPPGSRFDLKLVWYENGQQKQYWLNQVECSQDRREGN